MIAVTAALALLAIDADEPSAKTLVKDELAALRSADLCARGACEDALPGADLASAACQRDDAASMLRNVIGLLETQSPVTAAEAQAALSEAFRVVDQRLARLPDTVGSDFRQQLLHRAQVDQILLRERAGAPRSDWAAQVDWRRAACEWAHQNSTFLSRHADEAGFGLLLDPAQEVRSAAQVIIQHSQEPELANQAIAWLEAAVVDGAPLNEEAAAVIDRRRIRASGQQVYGTHFVCTNGRAAFRPDLSDPEAVDRERKRRGMSGLAERRRELDAICDPD